MSLFPSRQRPAFRTHLTPHLIHPSPLRVVAHSRLRQSSELLQPALVSDNFLQTRAFLTHASIPILQTSLSYSSISPRSCYASLAPPVTCLPKRFSPSHEEKHPLPSSIPRRPQTKQYISLYQTDSLMIFRAALHPELSRPSLLRRRSLSPAA